MLSQYLLIHSEAIKATIKEIYGKNSKAAIYDPSLAHKGGGGGVRGVKLTGYLDSPHMVSYYLPVHFLALNAILKKIIGGCQKITHK